MIIGRLARIDKKLNAIGHQYNIFEKIDLSA
jgi:hypothetical protein